MLFLISTGGEAEPKLIAFGSHLKCCSAVCYFFRNTLLELCTTVCIHVFARTPIVQLNGIRHDLGLN